MTNHTCSEQQGHDHQAHLGAPVIAKPVHECASLHEVFEQSLRAFGGSYLRRVYSILREVIAREIPLVVTVAGPITLSDQHRAWLIPLIEAGWVAYLTVTDAICYHDGHDSLEDFKDRPVGEVNLFGDDGAYRDAKIIRVADTGFPEDILFKQDKMISMMLSQPEFQKRMTTTERNYLFGEYYAAQEQAFRVRPGLLSTCYHLGIPVFVGAAADGSAHLNSLKLWTLSKIGGKSYNFDYDLHADTFEACAYHYWGLFHSQPKTLAILILGGGVPKNYSLQPEPTLSQIFLLPDIRGYDYDVQIVSAPVTDGSLSSCFPSEAVSWGKINPDTYRRQTESLQGDYSMLMPFVARALLEDPTLKRRQPLRLYEQREQLVQQLFEVIKQRGALEETLDFPLQLIARAAQ